MLFLASPLASYVTPIPIPTLSLSLTLTPYLGGVLFLASPLASYVTGHTLEVTGGMGI